VGYQFTETKGVASHLCSKLTKLTQEVSLGTQSAQHSHETASTQESIISLTGRQAIADQLEAMAIELRSLTDDQMQAVPTEGTLLGLAKSLYGARRRIDEIFGMAGFSVSPAWDIMLDLYQACTHGKQISVSSACIGAACPPTTGLRWLHALETMQLIERRLDADDKRRTNVLITEKGRLHTAQALQMHMKG
jgi:hypothetical protein